MRSFVALVMVMVLVTSAASAAPRVALGERSGRCDEDATCVAVELARTLTNSDDGSLREERFVLDAGLAFEFGRARMYSRGREAVAAIARPWLARPGLEMIQVEGHTDDVGSEDYNLDLSRRRAERAKAVLLRLGFLANQIEVVGMGSSQPREHGTSAEARRKNRRVELVFVTRARPR